MQPSGGPPCWMVRPPGNYGVGVVGTEIPEAAEPHVCLARSGAGDDARIQCGREPCWTEDCAREHEVARIYALCSWCGVFAPGAKP